MHYTTSHVINSRPIPVCNAVMKFQQCCTCILSHNLVISNAWLSCSEMYYSFQYLNKTSIKIYNQKLRLSAITPVSRWWQMCHRLSYLPRKKDLWLIYMWLIDWSYTAIGVY